MIYRSLAGLVPHWLRSHILHFESTLESSAAAFAASIPSGARVLDAGAGELRYAHLFRSHRYVAADLAVGDPRWDYGKLDCIADLTTLPFRDAAFDACVNIVTLEHVREPAAVVAELGRILRPGGRLFLCAPLEWEVHQSPHDYYRYTLHGLRYLLERAGFDQIEIQPVGGFFRLLSRRLWNGLQFFPGPAFFLGALAFAPAALILPFFDFLDKRRDFTPGYICHACRSVNV